MITRSKNYKLGRMVRRTNIILNCTNNAVSIPTIPLGFYTTHQGWMLDCFGCYIQCINEVESLGP